jgi:outer membrane biosynthesis protein TonB
VVTNYNPKSSAEEPAVVNAHPNAGWSSFRKYLKENAHSPDGKTGVVKLSFMVDNNGAISDIKITKGLSQVTDQAAINLINDGPDWVGNTNRQPEKVSLKIKFVK